MLPSNSLFFQYSVQLIKRKLKPGYSSKENITGKPQFLIIKFYYFRIQVLVMENFVRLPFNINYLIRKIFQINYI